MAEKWIKMLLKYLRVCISGFLLTTERNSYTFSFSQHSTTPLQTSITKFVSIYISIPMGPGHPLPLISKAFMGNFLLFLFTLKAFLNPILYSPLL